MRRLTTTEMTILGMMWGDTSGSGSVHGYELHRRLTDGVVAAIIQIEPGMIYHYLKKLSAAGLMSTTVEEQTGRPDRHIHALTDTGKSAFQSWMLTPVRATRELRMEFLLKLWFARKIGQQMADDLVRDQIAVTSELATSLSDQLARVAGDDDDAWYLRRVLELRLSQHEAALHWLETMRMVE